LEKIIPEHVYSFHRRDKINQDRRRLEELFNIKLRAEETEEIDAKGERVIRVRWIPKQ